MNTQKFIIGLIVGMFVVAGVWYFLRTPDIEAPAASRTSATTSTYWPTMPPHVTPPTTPPPGAGSQKPSVSISGIRGIVTIGPTCPVVPAYDSEGKCADRPFAANFRVRNLSGAVVEEFSSNDDGTFSVSLPAGTYNIEQMPGALYPRISSPTQGIVVKQGAFTVITIEFDTGMR